MLTPASDDDWLRTIQQSTPARILAGRTGLSYRSATQFSLRSDHAAARDAVQRDLDPLRDFPPGFAAERRLLVVQTLAASKEQYLLRPDLGRRLSPAARSEVAAQCRAGADLQVVIGDGLSAAAVSAQVPRLLPLLEAGAQTRKWSLGQTPVVRHCRVGIMNDLGDILLPRVLVLLIGERPGLATAESLSAYFAWRPRSGQTDAHRNLISNIHDGGIPVAAAAQRILALAGQLMQAQTSGVQVKEQLSTACSTMLPKS
jgi:ethanolamine ammonia-lyase small subunit